MRRSTSDPNPDGRREPVRYRDQSVRHHGPRRDYVYPGRRVVDGDWRYPSPEQCEHTGPDVWLNDGEVLICPCCGLDDT